MRLIKLLKCCVFIILMYDSLFELFFIFVFSFRYGCELWLIGSSVLLWFCMISVGLFCRLLVCSVWLMLVCNDCEVVLVFVSRLCRYSVLLRLVVCVLVELIDWLLCVGLFWVLLLISCMLEVGGMLLLIVVICVSVVVFIVVGWNDVLVVVKFSLYRLLVMLVCESVLLNVVVIDGLIL